MKSRKAISDLIATVLIVLITIAAVGIIWGAIMPIIKSNIESSQKCTNAGLEINTQSGYTYVSGENISIQISRGASTIALNGIQIKIMDKTGNSNTTVLGIAYVPVANADKVYNFNVTAMGLDKTGIKKVGVAPIVALGNLNYTCPMRESEMPQ
jgi:hypothetical protein